MELRVIFLLALLFFSGLIFPKPEDTSDPEHPFAKHLTSLYTGYLDAARQGDVASAMDKTTDQYQEAFSNIPPNFSKVCVRETSTPASHILLRLMPTEILQELSLRKMQMTRQAGRL